MRLLSIGADVRTGLYRVHSRFNRVVNFHQAGRLAAVVHPTVGAGPLHVVLAEMDIPRVATLAVHPGAIDVNGCRVPIPGGVRYTASLPKGAGSAQRFHRNLLALRELLVRTAPPKSMAFVLDGKRIHSFRPGFERAVVARLQQGYTLVRRGCFGEGVRVLNGCGFGLTPSGDDFTVGVVLALHGLRALHGIEVESLLDATCAASESENLLSRSALELARCGRVPEVVREWVETMLEGSPAAVGPASRRLFGMGHSSGADLATGFYTVAAECRNDGVWAPAINDHGHTLEVV